MRFESFSCLILRVTQLENLLVEKDRVITELTSEKKNMEKIKRDQEKQIGVLQNDRDYNTRVKFSKASS